MTTIIVAKMHIDLSRTILVLAISAAKVEALDFVKFTFSKAITIKMSTISENNLKGRQISLFVIL